MPAPGTAGLTACQIPVGVRKKKKKKAVQDLDPSNLTAECLLHLDTKDESRPPPDTVCPISERERRQEGVDRNGKTYKNNFSFSNCLGKRVVGSNKW